jgi:hypothetical protein
MACIASMNRVTGNSSGRFRGEIWTRPVKSNMI